MSTEQILKVLKNERECIKRQSDINKCKRHEHEGCLKCDLCLPDYEILEVYDRLIHLCESEAIIIADISEEDKAKIVRELANAGYGIAPELAEKYLGVDETARAIFNGICPYTNIKCDEWTCSICKIEARERAFAKGNTD